MEKSDDELKHLGFVKVVAINAAVCISHLYDYGKQNSGSFKSTIETVEKVVTTVVRPVYDSFKGVPHDVVVFLDKKVDEWSSQFDEYAPSVAKKIAGKAQQVVKKASDVVAAFAQEAVTNGPSAAISQASTSLKIFFVGKIAVIWYAVNRFPPLHLVGDMAIPAVASLSQKYNKFTSKMDARGYHIFAYFPSIPVEDIAQAYKQQVEAGAVKKDD